MSLYDWNSVPLEQLSPLLSRRVIHTPGLTIAKLKLLKGAVVPLHSHVNEQVTTMDSGSLLFELAGEEVIVRAGQSLTIPPHAPHRVEALEDSEATDVFTPARKDWIRGDDAYLRK
jgi:quercetin dioxygenase-like cupin family protein